MRIYIINFILLFSTSLLAQVEVGITAGINFYKVYLKIIYASLLVVGLIHVSLGQGMPNISSLRIPYNNPNTNYPHTRFNNNPSYVVPKTFIEKKSKWHIYNICFKDSSILNTEGKIDMHDGRYFLSVDHGNRAILPNETFFINTTSNDELLTGMPTDSCWLFTLYTGKITLYSSLPESDVRFVMKIRTGDGPLLQLTKKNLAGMVEPDNPLQEMIKRGDLYGSLKKYIKQDKQQKVPGNKK